MRRRVHRSHGLDRARPPVEPPPEEGAEPDDLPSTSPTHMNDRPNGFWRCFHRKNRGTDRRRSCRAIREQLEHRASSASSYARMARSATGVAPYRRPRVAGWAGAGPPRRQGAGARWRRAADRVAAARARRISTSTWPTSFRHKDPPGRRARRRRCARPPARGTQGSGRSPMAGASLPTVRRRRPDIVHLHSPAMAAVVRPCSVPPREAGGRRAPSTTSGRRSVATRVANGVTVPLTTRPWRCPRRSALGVAAPPGRPGSTCRASRSTARRRRRERADPHVSSASPTTSRRDRRELPREEGLPDAARGRRSLRRRSAAPLRLDRPGPARGRDPRAPRAARARRAASRFLGLPPGPPARRRRRRRLHADVTPRGAPDLPARGDGPRACPPVASAVGGIPEVVTDGADGLLLPPGDVAAFAAAFRRLRDDRRRAQRLGRARRSEELVTSTSRETQAEMLEALYRGCWPSAAGPRPARVERPMSRSGSTRYPLHGGFGWRVRQTTSTSGRISWATERPAGPRRAGGSSARAPISRWSCSTGLLPAASYAWCCSCASTAACPTRTGRLRRLASCPIALSVAVLWSFGLYGQVWRHASAQEARRLLGAPLRDPRADSASTWASRSVPWSVLLLGTGLGTFAIGAVRFQSRLFSFRRARVEPGGVPVIVIGAQGRRRGAHRARCSASQARAPPGRLPRPRPEPARAVRSWAFASTGGVERPPPPRRAHRSRPGDPGHELGHGRHRS